MSLMFSKPPVKIEVIVLLAPEHPCRCLTVNTAFVLAQRTRCNPVIKFVRVRQSGIKDLVKVSEGSSQRFSAQPQSYPLAAACRHFEPIMGSRFRPRFCRIHCILLTGDDVIVK